MPIPDQAPAPQAAGMDNPYGSRIRFSQQLFPPPGAIYMGPSDFLVLNIRCPDTTANVIFNWAVLKADGTIEYNGLNGSLVAQVNAQNFSTTPSEGFLIGYALTTDNPSRGQVYCKVFLQNPNFAYSQLSCGYTSLMVRQTFPFPINEDSRVGAGWLRTVTIPDVTGGTASWNVPAGVYWLIRSIRSEVQPSGAGVARNISLDVQPPGGSIPVQIGAAATIAPGGNQVIDWASGNVNASVGLFQTVGFPDTLIVGPGYAISVVITVLDVGDKISGNSALVEEFVGL